MTIADEIDEIREAERKVIQSARMVTRAAVDGTLLFHVASAVDDLRGCLSELDALEPPPSGKPR